MQSTITARVRAGSVGFALLSAVALGLWLPADPGRAQEPNLIPNGDFETGTSGWFPASGPATLSADANGPAVSGSAARVRSTAPGLVIVQSQYWLTPVQPGAAYRLEVHVTDSDAFIVTHVRLAFRCSNGSSFIKEEGAVSGGIAPFRRYVASAVAPPSCDYARVEIDGDAFEANALFTFDAVQIVMTAPAPPPPPPPTATVTASATASATATSAATAPATPATTGTATPSTTTSPTATDSASPTASATPGISAALWNADFTAASAGWATVAGTTEGSGGGFTLRATGTGTAYIQQAVTITPGGWYVAGATLTPQSNVSAAWVRIAWYASPDGSGGQLSTEDSPAVSAGSHALSTGPVQAPVTAKSARVRILLRPLAPGASLNIQQVFFASTTAPAPTPTATSTSAPAAAAPPAPPAAAAAPSASRPTPTTTAHAETSPGSPTVAGTTSVSAPARPGGALPSGTNAPNGEGQQWLRISEVLPNPAQPGVDTDYEWVEITNFGPNLVSTEGMLLGDNRGSIAVEAVMLPPGASLVIATPLAEVGVAPLVQRVSAIGNGLSNSGDRLVLIDAAGNVVDQFSYGSDRGIADTEPIATPREGYSIERRFDGNGVLVDVAFLDVPTPGTASIVEPADATATPSIGAPQGSDGGPGSEAPLAVGGSVSGPARAKQTSVWLLLLVVGAGALGGAAFYRVSVIARNRSTS